MTSGLSAKGDDGVGGREGAELHLHTMGRWGRGANYICILCGGGGGGQAELHLHTMEGRSYICIL